MLPVRGLPSGLRSSRNDGVLDPSVGAAIQSAVSESMDSLTDNLTKVTY